MAYIGKTPSQATRQRYYFTATGGETSLSGADDNANTLTFTDGNYVDVMLNGVTLVAGTDYNTTTANTIGGLAALVASDIVEVVVYDTFSVFGGNVVGNFNLQNGNLTVGGTVNATSYTGDGSSLTGINTDLVSDTTPQLGGNLDTNGNDITFGDNDKAIFGAGSDLQIYHDGSGSFISDQGTGNIKILAGNFKVHDTTDTEIIAQFNQNADVSLYYDNSQKLATTNTGIDVTGTVTADGLTVDTTTLVVDSANNRVGIGTSSPASKLELEDSVNGDMHLRINNTSTGTSARTFLLLQSDGATGSLFLNGANRLTSGIDEADSMSLTSDASASNGLNINASAGSIKFYNNNSEAMRITSSGRVGVGTTTPSHELTVAGSSDTRVTVDGSNSAGFYLTDSGSNGITIRNTNNGDLEFLTVGGKETVFNQLGVDTNFRVESDTNSNAFFVEGSSGNVGIGTNSPAQPLHISGSAPVIQLTDTDTGADHLISGASGVGSLFIHADVNSEGSNSAMLFQIKGSERMRIDSSGNVLVGNSSYNSNNIGSGFSADGFGYHTRDGALALSLRRKTSDGGILDFRKDSAIVGSVSVTSSGTTYNTTSDARLKADIQPIADAKDRLMQMNPVSHKWKADPEAGAVVGFIAQEMQEIVPEAVSGDPDGDEMMSMDYGRITPVLVAALQDAHKKIEELESRLAAVEAK